MIHELSKPQLNKTEIEFCKSFSLKLLPNNVDNRQLYLKLGCERFLLLNDDNASCYRKFGDERLRLWKRQTPMQTLQCDPEYSEGGGVGLLLGINSGRNGDRIDRSMRKSSSVTCKMDPDTENAKNKENTEQGYMCELRKVRIDSSKIKTVLMEQRMRPNWNFTAFGTPSMRIFDQKFMISDCKSAGYNYSADNISNPLGNVHNFYTPYIDESESKETCDVVYNNPTIMTSHDHIINVGHMINDHISVWYMLWLAGLASPSLTNAANFLNVDSLHGEPEKGYYAVSKNDEINIFFAPYLKNFKRVLKMSDFMVNNKTKKNGDGAIICFDKLYIFNGRSATFAVPKRLLDRCSLRGPSSLMQRFNIHIRKSFGLLRYDLPLPLKRGVQVVEDGRSTAIQDKDEENYAKPYKVIFINRKIKPRSDGSIKMNLVRIVLNFDEVSSALRTTIHEANERLGSTLELVVLDLSDLGSYEDQLLTLAKTSVVIGLHGAGMAHAIHLPVGEDQCCGAIELFPDFSWFKDVSHGNMLREAGVHYESIDMDVAAIKDTGVVLPIDKLRGKLSLILEKVVNKPSCILPEVLEDPYFEKI